MRFRLIHYFQLFVLFVAINPPSMVSAESNLTVNNLVQEERCLRLDIAILKKALQVNFSLQSPASLAGLNALCMGRLAPRVNFFWKYYYCFEQLKTMLPNVPWNSHFIYLTANVELFTLLISHQYSILQLQAEQKAWQLILDVVRLAKNEAFPAFKSLGDIPWTEQQLIVFINNLLHEKCVLGPEFNENIRSALFSGELCYWQTTFDQESLGLATLLASSLLAWFEHRAGHHVVFTH